MKRTTGQQTVWMPTSRTRKGMSQTRQRIMEVIEAVLQRNQPPLNGTLMRENAVMIRPENELWLV